MRRPGPGWPASTTIFTDTGIDRLLSRLTDRGEPYYQTHAPGSVHGLVGAAGDEASRDRYDVYGECSADREGVATPWGIRRDGDRARGRRRRDQYPGPNPSRGRHA